MLHLSPPISPLFFCIVSPIPLRHDWLPASCHFYPLSYIIMWRFLTRRRRSARTDVRYHHHGSFGTVEVEQARSAVPLSGGVLEISLVQDPGPICQRDAPTERKCWAQAGEPSAPPQRYPGTSVDCKAQGVDHTTPCTSPPHCCHCLL